MNYIRDTCLGNCADCRGDGSLGYCCSGICNQNAEDDVGYCVPPRGENCDESPSTKSPCIADCDPCHKSGSLGFCCSGMCIQIQGEDFGYCQARGEQVCDIPENPDCIPDCEECKGSGSMGFCCSGMCIQTGDIGFCKSRNSTECDVDIPLDKGGDTKLILQLLPYLLSGLVILVLAGVSIWLWRYWKNRKEKLLNKEEVDQFYKGSTTTEGSVVEPEAFYGAEYSKVYRHIECMPYEEKFEVEEKAFSIDPTNILGSGQFGTVIKGTLNGDTVAVKTVKENAEKVYLKSLLTELKALIYLGKHENIVNLMGAYTKKIREGKVYIFLEFCHLGSLYSYLRNGRNAPQISANSGYAEWGGGAGYVIAATPTNPYSAITMLTWASQISNGLAYLGEKRMIHGDLATRNVLLYSETHVKITDFGLSRRLYEYSVYKKGYDEPLPWRWMSLESLQGLTFSAQSDVWSLGVTMWEIFSLGDLPFPGHTWSEHFVNELVGGMRLPKPSFGCEMQLYQLMQQCWNSDPNKRPSANQVSAELTQQVNDLQSRGDAQCHL